MKKEKLSILLNIVLAILLIVSFFTYGFRSVSPTKLNPGDSQGIVNKAIAVIKTKLPSNKDIILKGFQEENFYRVSSSVVDKGSTSTAGGDDFPFYLNSDGTKLFTRYIPLEPEKTPEPKKSDKPNVLLFTMAFCPYGNQAENNIEPALKLLSKDINFEAHYVIYGGGQYKKMWDKYCLTKEAKYCSMHGVGELHQDIRELCVNKYYPNKYWSFVLSVNKNCDASNVDKCWEKWAKNEGLDINKIKTCQEKEASSLLEKEVSLNKQYKVQGSPTLIINGENYRGKRTPEAYKQAVCNAFNNPPQECQTKLSDESVGPEGSCQ